MTQEFVIGTACYLGSDQQSNFNHYTDTQCNLCLAY